MKKHLTEVPLYVPVGTVESGAADDAVTNGRAHSLRGRALLLFSPAHLAEILSQTNLDPRTVALVLRAAARVESEKAAAAAARAGEAGASDTEAC